MATNGNGILSEFNDREAVRFITTHNGELTDFEITSPQNRGGYYVLLGELSETQRKLLEAHFKLAAINYTLKHSDKFNQDVFAVPVTETSLEKLQGVKKIIAGETASNAMFANRDPSPK